jgi:hypothetical protein
MEKPLAFNFHPINLGYKFLSGNLKCGYDEEFYYNAPKYNQDGTWTAGEWTECKNADRNSYDSCGQGLHLMKTANPVYVKYTGNAYLAEGREILGQDDEKARYVAIRLLRPLTTAEIFHPKAKLGSAKLRGAYLMGADLMGADLRGAYLMGADLMGADLMGAYLRGANLMGADLRGAYLMGAYLRGANLMGADLRGAYLMGAIGYEP